MTLFVGALFDKIFSKMGFLRLLKEKTRQCKKAYINYRMCSKSRRIAFNHLRTVTAGKEVQVVDKNLKREIRRYCKRTFGSSSYWPWLALYSEIRGEFIEGWMPSDYFNAYILPGINPYHMAYISMQKTLTYKLFGDLTVKPILIIIDQMIYDANYLPISICRAQMTLNDYNDEVVIKKDYSCRGNHVRFIHASNVRLKDFLGNGRYVIQPMIVQQKSIAEIYPVSSNTFRVITYLDTNQKVHIKGIFLKFGANGSRVDNTARGGRFVIVDQKGTVMSDAITKGGQMMEKCHPNTGKIYRDLILPPLDKLCNTCIKAHYLFPYCGIIGWDVILNKDGEPMIIEWNAHKPAFWYNEALNGPMFDTSELLSLYSIKKKDY